MDRDDTSDAVTGNNSDAVREHGPASSAKTPTTPIAQRHFDPDEGDELATAIVFALADAMEVSPSEVTDPPLYDAVDVTALENTFFGPRTVTETERQGVGTVEFRYADYLVRVRSDGWIQIHSAIET